MQATPAAIMAIAAGVPAALGCRGKIRPVALKRPITLEEGTNELVCLAHTPGAHGMNG